MLLGLSIPLRVLVICYCYRQSGESLASSQPAQRTGMKSSNITRGCDEKHYDFSNPLGIRYLSKVKNPLKDLGHTELARSDKFCHGGYQHCFGGTHPGA